MQLIHLEDIFSAFLDIIVCFIEHRNACQLRTGECAKRMKEEAIDSYSDAAEKNEGKHKTSGV